MIQTDKSKNKKFYQNKKEYIALLYIVGFIGMLLLIVGILVTRKAPNEQKNDYHFIRIDDQFTLSPDGGEPVKLNQLGQNMNPETGSLSIYYQLPELQEDVSLIYRTKDIYSELLIDGETIYQTSVYESKFYNRSPGNLRNIVKISSRQSGKVLEIRIFMVYDTNAVTLDSVYLGDKADIIIYIFESQIFEILISLFLVLLGVVLVIIEVLPTYGKTRKNHGFLWIGMFALQTGVWSLLETNILQFVVHDMRILQFISNMLMITDTMPLLLYLNAEYQLFKNKYIRTLGYFATGYIICAVLVQYSGIGDLHKMLNVSIFLMMIEDIVLFIAVIKKLINLSKEHKPYLNCVLQIIGISSLWFFGIFESIRSLHEDRIDRAGLIRFGMLLLCFFFALSNQIETYRILEQGLKYDFVRKLAYQDGLTGLGNRTAYLETIQELEKKELTKEAIGIIYLDINNLKTVNDTIGHESGDDLIRIAGNIIKDSFGHQGKTFRIGGDEFCVLMTGTNLMERYEHANGVFIQLIEEVNQAQWYPFIVQIAHGFAICRELNHESIDSAIAEADGAMYENKQKLKFG